MRQNAGFGDANDPNRASRHIKVGVNISSPQKCVFKTVVTTAYSKGASKESFDSPSSEVTTLDFNKVQRLAIEEGSPPSVVIEGKGMALQGRQMSGPHDGCHINVPTGGFASRD